VVAVPAQALERGDRTAVVGAEALGPGQRRRPRQLAEQLPLAWAADVDLVQEGRDRVVVVAQEPEPLERVRVVVVVGGVRTPILRRRSVTA
jgi:hypothetical protein